jgi:hypothetical protein
MNIALEKTEEHVNGVKKRSYGDAFVRGNNGDYILLEIYIAGLTYWPQLCTSQRIEHEAPLWQGMVLSSGAFWHNKCKNTREMDDDYKL